MLWAEGVDEYIDNLMPDMVIHAAGDVGGIQYNIDNGQQLYAHNLLMGSNLLQSVYRCRPACKVINIGSSCMYPADAPQPFKEESLGTGEPEPTNAAYAHAKIAVWRLAKSLGLKTVVPCNMYGPFDHFDAERGHLIPAAIRKVYDCGQTGEPLTIWGTGSVRREFMYVGDFVDFLLWAIENYDDLPDTVNVGTGKEYTVDKYYTVIQEEMFIPIKNSPCQTIHDTTKPEGIASKTVDTSKLDRLGWTATTTLTDGIAQTVEHYNRCCCD